MFATKVETPRYRSRVEMVKMVSDIGIRTIGSNIHEKVNHN